MQSVFDEDVKKMPLASGKVAYTILPNSGTKPFT
jgi:hypothetical protein